MNDKIEDESIPNPLGIQLLRDPGENVKENYYALYLINGVFREGFFILTDQRIIVLGKKSRIVELNIPLTAITEVSVEENVRIDREFRNVLKIAAKIAYALTVKNSKYLIDIREQTVNIEEITETILKLRAREMLRTSPSIDFHLLKDILDKGGILVTTIKCPSCGGLIDFPNKGKFIKCRYCGSTIFVEEVINIIRELERL